MEVHISFEQQEKKDVAVDLELELKISHRELRVLLLHEFCLDHTENDAARNISGTMGKGVLSIRTAQHWFHRLKNGSFELDGLSPHQLQHRVDACMESMPFHHNY